MEKLNFALRISVIDKCNFACRYCPNTTSMENYCPSELKKNHLNSQEITSVLQLIFSKYKFSKIVITGGEPMMSPVLGDILPFLKSSGHYIELDTNGSLFSNDYVNMEQWNLYFKYINGIKISLDSLKQQTYMYLSNSKHPNAINNTLSLIEEAIKKGLEVTINTVYTKINYEDIGELVDFAVSKKININILDLYWSRETNEFWLDNYLPTDDLEKQLEEKFERLVSDDSIYGCDFSFIYYDNKHYIKLKRSNTRTMRDSICDECEHYCQEGLFSLRMSCQGYFTACQSSDNKHGALIRTDFDMGSLEKIIQRLKTAVLNEHSFNAMLKKNKIPMRSD